MNLLIYRLVVEELVDTRLLPVLRGTLVVLQLSRDGGV
jgi:hypothetical protein